MPRTSSRTTNDAVPALCDADAALRGASAPMRRLHRSVRQFYAGMQMALHAQLAPAAAAGSPSHAHSSIAEPDAAESPASLWDDAKRLFVGPLSRADLDAVAARDDTVRRSLEHLAQRDAAYRAEEDACLRALKEELGSILSDPGLPAGEKARLVAGIAQKRRELAVKRAQRHGDTEAIEGSLRDALFAALPSFSLEYGDEGLESGDSDSDDGDQPSASDGAALAREAGIARRRALRPFDSGAQQQQQQQRQPRAASAEADRAAEMSVHAMLAKALAMAISVGRAGRSAVSTATKGAAAAAKRSQQSPRSDELAAPVLSSGAGGGLYGRLGIDLMRHLTVGWGDSAAASPSDDYLSSRHVPVAARQVSLRWSAADMLLWPRQGQLHGDQRNAADIAAAFARDGPLVARALERHAASDGVIVRDDRVPQHTAAAAAATTAALVPRVSAAGGPSPAASPNETSVAPPAVVAVPRSSAPIPPSPAPSPNGATHVPGPAAGGASDPAPSSVAPPSNPTSTAAKSLAPPAPRVPTRYSQSFDEGSAQPQRPFSAEDAVDACGHEVKAAGVVSPWKDAQGSPPSPATKETGTGPVPVLPPPASPKAPASTQQQSSVGPGSETAAAETSSRPDDVSAAFLTEHPAALPTTIADAALDPDVEAPVVAHRRAAEREGAAAAAADGSSSGIAATTTRRGSRPASSTTSSAGARGKSSAPTALAATPDELSAALEEAARADGGEPGRALAADPFGTAMASPLVNAARSNLRQGSAPDAAAVSRSNARPLPRAKELALLEQSAAAERAMHLILSRAPLPASRQQGLRSSTSLTASATTAGGGGGIEEDVSFTASGQYQASGGGSGVSTQRNTSVAPAASTGGTFRLVGDVPPAWAQPRLRTPNSSSSSNPHQATTNAAVVAGDPHRVTGSELAPLKPSGLARKRVLRDSAAASMRRARSAAMDAEQDLLDGVGAHGPTDDGHDSGYDGDRHQPARPCTAPLPGGDGDDDDGGGGAVGAGALVPVPTEGVAPSGNYGRFVTDGSAERAGAVFGYFPLAKSKWQSGQQSGAPASKRPASTAAEVAASSPNSTKLKQKKRPGAAGSAAALVVGAGGTGRPQQTVDDVLASDASESAVQRRLRLRNAGPSAPLQLSGLAAARASTAANGAAK